MTIDNDRKVKPEVDVRISELQYVITSYRDKKNSEEVIFYGKTLILN